MSGETRAPPPMASETNSLQAMSSPSFTALKSTHTHTHTPTDTRRTCKHTHTQDLQRQRQIDRQADRHALYVLLGSPECPHTFLDQRARAYRACSDVLQQFPALRVLPDNALVAYVALHLLRVGMSAEKFAALCTHRGVLAQHGRDP
eukprot:5098209-Amphidinium_carterae.2